MTTSTAQDIRYPLDGIVTAITAAMAGSDYTSTAEWEQPPECRCRREGISCLSVQALSSVSGVRECRGYVAGVPVSPDKALTPDMLIAVLPVPDDSGTVSGQEAASALTHLVKTRLGWNQVWMSSLARRLAEAFSDLEDSLAGTASPAVPAGVLRCQVCTKELEAGCKRSRRTCSDACRQRLRRMRA